MSQHSENDDSDDDYYFLQPVSNQYNITDKIKEANQELYKGEKFQRSTQPKVRFRDHQLVDYEPEEDEVSVELMEKRSSISIHSNNNDIIVKIKEEESSDDGYIDDEDETVVPDGERIVVESIEIEEVCEQIEMLETSIEDVLRDDTSTNDDETYTREDFHEDSIESVIVTTTRMRMERKARQQKQKPRELSPPPSQQQLKRKSTKKVFRSKINPSIDDMLTPASAADIPPPTAPSITEKRVTSARTKACCENNNEYKQKLPKYNGYNSNYGLSKDEIDRRRFNQLRNNEIQQYRTARQVEQKEHVAKVNEEAFAKWLRKKMRHSINKSNPINMYDVKPSARQRQQQYSKRRHFQRQMETEENDDEDEESEVLPEEGDEEI